MATRPFFPPGVPAKPWAQDLRFLGEYSRAVIARHTGVIVRTAFRASDVQRLVVDDLVRGMEGSERTRRLFKDTSRVRALVGDLEKLQSGDAELDEALSQYVNAVLNVSAAARRPQAGVAPAVHGTGVGWLRGGSYEQQGGAKVDRSPGSGWIKAELQALRRGPVGHSAAFARLPRAPGRVEVGGPGAGYVGVSPAGGQRPANYRPPLSAEMGAFRRASNQNLHLSLRASANLPLSGPGRYVDAMGVPVMHAAYRTQGGRLVNVPRHALEDPKKLRAWAAAEYGRDAGVREFVNGVVGGGMRLRTDYNFTQRGVPMTTGERLRPGVRPVGLTDAHLEALKGAHFDALAKSARGGRGGGTSSGGGGGPGGGGTYRGKDSGKTVIPYGKFKGLTLEQLTRKFSTGSGFQRKDYENALYYLSAMGDSEWARQTYKGFFRAYDDFVKAWKDELAPWGEVNWFGGRSPRDLQIKLNPYRPSTWDHPHTVSLRDSDLPYRDRWEEQARGHRLGYDVRKEYANEYDDRRYEIEMDRRLTPGERLRRVQELKAWAGDLGSYDNMRKQQRLANRNEFNRLRGVKWSYDEKTSRWVRVRGPQRELSYYEERRQYWKDFYVQKMAAGLQGATAVSDAPTRYDPDAAGEEYGLNDPDRPRARKKHMRVGGAPRSYEELLVSKMNYARQFDWVVRSQASKEDKLQMLRDLAERVENDVPGGWAAVDYAQGLIGPGLEGFVRPVEWEEYPEDPYAERYSEERSLRAYWYRARALVMAGQ